MAAPAQPKKIVAPTVSQINAEFVTQVRARRVCGRRRPGAGVALGGGGRPPRRALHLRKAGPKGKSPRALCRRARRRGAGFTGEGAPGLPQSGREALSTGDSEPGVEKGGGCFSDAEEPGF